MLSLLLDYPSKPKPDFVSVALSNYVARPHDVASDRATLLLSYICEHADDLVLPESGVDAMTPIHLRSIVDLLLQLVREGTENSKVGAMQAAVSIALVAEGVAAMSVQTSCGMLVE